MACLWHFSTFTHLPTSTHYPLLLRPTLIAPAMHERKMWKHTRFDVMPSAFIIEELKKKKVQRKMKRIKREKKARCNVRLEKKGEGWQQWESSRVENRRVETQQQWWQQLPGISLVSSLLPWGLKSKERYVSCTQLEDAVCHFPYNNRSVQLPSPKAIYLGVTLCVIINWKNIEIAIQTRGNFKTL